MSCNKHATIRSAYAHTMTNPDKENIKESSFKSSANIQKKEGGPDKVIDNIYMDVKKRALSFARNFVNCELMFICTQ